MASHRFSQLLQPSAASELSKTVGFVACPIAFQSEQQTWLTHLYRAAIEKAHADHQPSAWYRTIFLVTTN